jgi:hypothetical protein
MTAAALPLWLAVLGIVLRGAGFAFRKEVEDCAPNGCSAPTFAFSSLLTPFFMGTVVGCRGSRQGGARRPELHARDMDEPDLAAHRRVVRRRVWLPGRHIPHR